MVLLLEGGSDGVHEKPPSMVNQVDGAISP